MSAAEEGSGFSCKLIKSLGINKKMNPGISLAICKVHLLFPLNVPVNINCLLVALPLDITSSSDGIELPS